MNKQSGRPKIHPDTSPAHPRRLSPKALDLLRRVAKMPRMADNYPLPIVIALFKRGLIIDEDLGGVISITTAGRALLAEMDKEKGK